MVKQARDQLASSSEATRSTVGSTLDLRINSGVSLASTQMTSLESNGLVDQNQTLLLGPNEKKKPHFDFRGFHALKMDFTSKLKHLFNKQGIHSEEQGSSNDSTNTSNLPPPTDPAPSGLLSQEALSKVFPKCSDSYIAVSHMWGATANLYDKTRKAPFHSTPVLDLSKLVLMQNLVETGYAWIDVYDVNQTDESIKAAQVQWMGEVYFYADMVLWVTTAKDDQTLSLLQDIGIAMTSSNSFDNLVSVAKKESARILSWSPPRQSKAGTNVGAFEHWCRAWTYQEIALAKSMHAVSPYTGSDWNISSVFATVRKISDIIRTNAEAKNTDIEEMKHLKLLIKGARNDFHIISIARPHGPSKYHGTTLENRRIHRESTVPRLCSYAKDVLFTHLWTFQIPKDQLDYDRNVEWNIRQFCAYLISKGQMTIASNHSSIVENGCWIPSDLLVLKTLDEERKGGDTSVLQCVRVKPLPNSKPLPFRVLENGQLEIETKVRQLYGDVWLAYLNVKESVCFLKEKSHIVSLTDSRWVSNADKIEKVTFGSSQQAQ